MSSVYQSAPLSGQATAGVRCYTGNEVSTLESTETLEEHEAVRARLAALTGTRIAAQAGVGQSQALVDSIQYNNPSRHTSCVAIWADGDDAS